MPTDIQTDILIVGAGPAGASLAAFLGQNGLSGLVLAKDSATAYTPRAHGMNPFALVECLRDIDLEDEALRLAIRGPHTLSMRFSKTLIGTEYGRVAAWGEQPTGKMKEVTPCEYVDLPQRYLEPLLSRYASHHNFHIRFSTEVVSVEPLDTHDSEGFLCTIRDYITQQTLQVQAKYLFGADGARSVVSKSLGFAYSSNPAGITACSVLLRADLAKYMVEERKASLSWVVNPGNKVFPGVITHLRVVRPWNEWVMMAFGPDGKNPFAGLGLDDPKLVAFAREIIGDESISIEILALDPWTVRDSVAVSYSKNGLNAFILGDAAHRHPPAYGLGSNTCLQDAYNLAWKVAFVSNGLAGRSLLDTFSHERQPVGKTLVRESNIQLRANNEIWEALGSSTTPSDKGLDSAVKLASASVEGSSRRAKLHHALEIKRQEVESLGLAYNQWYTSEAVYSKDEDAPRPSLEGNPIVELQVSTYPGSRLPHAWLDIPERGRMISTLDLAGKGAFCLLTGVGGEAWRAAAENIQNRTGIQIRSFGLGPGLDYIDVHRDWHKRRGVQDDGCVLVRPDRFVAWRSDRLAENCTKKLEQVLDAILARHQLK
ncbi:hypothetical protein GQ53DRAFT_673387 [Thozetella sp. PMI_491]|nr:hypothetical protein GQ53DRAFT_673387 [Thozetella sp. PMI_491]